MSLYNVIVRKECDRYCAEVPDLPGCFTEADTLDELEANVREAITLYLEDSPVV
jgi:predicted RNase H-like HicB family nuclease